MAERKHDPDFINHIVSVLNSNENINLSHSSNLRRQIKLEKIIKLKLRAEKELTKTSKLIKDILNFKSY